MQQYLYKYLLLHHKLSIPALGNFVMQYQPAYLNESTGLLFPRRPVIEFNEGPALGSDKGLIDFLSVQMGVDERVAGKEFQNFSIELLVNMVEQHFTDLKGIGRIKKEVNGHIIFLPATNLIEILPPLRLGEKIKFNKLIKTPPPTREVKELPLVKEAIRPKEVPAAIRVVPERIVVPAREARAVKGIAQAKAILLKEANSGAKVVEMNIAAPEEETQKKDLWWLYAAILAVIGLAGLIFYVL